MQATGIIYCLIAKFDKTVLATQTKYKGNFPVISLEVLSKVNTAKTFNEYITQNYIFYTYSFEGITYLAMTDLNYELRLAVKFLKTVQIKLYGKYDQSQRNTTISFKLKAFSKTLQQLMTIYSTKKQQIDKLTQLKIQLSQLQRISLQNMNKIIQRSEKIQVVLAKSQALSRQSQDLSIQASQVHQQMWWKNKKVMIGIGIVVVIIIVVVVVVLIKVL